MYFKLHNFSVNDEQMLIQKFNINILLLMVTLIIQDFGIEGILI